MKYIAGYVLLVLGGNKSPSEKDLADFLKSCDCQVDAALAKTVVDALNGKSLHELCAAGMPKIANLASSSAAPAAAPAEEKKAAPKAEEKKKKEEAPPVEEAADLGDLFG